MRWHSTKRSSSPSHGQSDWERENLILESKEFLKTILDHFQGFITVVNQDHRILFANRALIKRTGHDPTGEICYKTFHGLDDTCPNCPKDEIFKEKKVVTRESKSPLDNRWYRVVYCPFSLPSGKQAMLAVVLDIHELWTFQKKAQKHQRILELIFEKAPFIFLGIKPSDGTIVYVNPAFKEILGYELDEVKGRCVFDFIAPEELDKAIKCCQIVCSGETKRNQELYWVTKNGKRRLIRSTCFLVKISDDEELVFTISRDITEIKRLEEQFLQAQKMEAVGRLAGGIAHDFNNLLTSLKSYLQLINLNLDNPEKVKQITSNMSTAINKAFALTQHLLTFSRRHHGKQEIIDLRQFLIEMRDFIERLVGEDIELSLVLPEKSLYVKANEGHLQQIMMNLVVNAKDAMPNGGLLEISLDTKVPDQILADKFSLPIRQYAVISVSDTGVGIPEEILPHIFDPFFTTKPNGKGTGLGLATVYSLVKQYQGHIFVSSEPGFGTVFTIYLPTVEPKAASERVEDSKSTSLPQGYETILFVEDEELVRQPVVELLRSLGYKVIEAQNGFEALEKLQRQPVDLIISDLVMPRMGGYELAERLKKVAPGIKIIFCSGYPKSSLPKFENENVTFLPKPYSLQALAQKIREILEKGA